VAGSGGGVVVEVDRADAVSAAGRELLCERWPEAEGAAEAARCGDGPTHSEESRRRAEVGSGETWRRQRELALGRRGDGGRLRWRALGRQAGSLGEAWCRRRGR